MKSHKKFGYQPRYYKGEGSPFKMEHRFDVFCSTAQPLRGLKNKFFWAIDDFKSGEESKKNQLIGFNHSFNFNLFLFSHY
jgi:hypothetical protein